LDGLRELAVLWAVAIALFLIGSSILLFYGLP
jgi:hypothetical protein